MEERDLRSRFDISKGNELVVASAQKPVEMVSGRNVISHVVIATNGHDLVRQVEKRISDSITQFAIDHPNLHGEHAAIAWMNENSDY